MSGQSLRHHVVADGINPWATYSVTVDTLVDRNAATAAARFESGRDREITATGSAKRAPGDALSLSGEMLAIGRALIALGQEFEAIGMDEAPE